MEVEVFGNPFVTDPFAFLHSRKRLAYGNEERAPMTTSGERIASRCVCCQSDNLQKSPAILMPFIAKRTFGWEPAEITEDWNLHDIKTGMAYPLCNSVRCASCGLVFLDIRFNDSEMASLYSGYRGKEYTALRERFEPGYASRAVIIAQGATHIPKVEAFLSAYVNSRPRLLDWGGDTGFNTPFKSQCSVFHVYDISNQPVVDGASRVDKRTVEGTDYDLIVLSHVLEHLPYPDDAISEIASVMKPETVLYIEIPHEDLMRLNHGATDTHTKKKYWHEHINFFTQDSLLALLERCGLRALGMQSIEAEGGGKHWHILSIACSLQPPNVNTLADTAS